MTAATAHESEDCRLLILTVDPIATTPKLLHLIPGRLPFPFYGRHTVGLADPPLFCDWDPRARPISALNVPRLSISRIPDQRPFNHAEAGLQSRASGSGLWVRFKREACWQVRGLHL